MLSLLVAFAGATVMTSVAGARRGESAVDRLLAGTLPATLAVLPNQTGFDWAAVRRLPDVAAVTTFPGYTALPLDEAPDDELSSFVPADADAMRTIERPIILAGRLADPAKAEEAVVTAEFVRAAGRGVGDTVTLRLPSLDQAGPDPDARDNAAPRGPVLRITIVGVIRSFWYADEAGGHGKLIPSPGLLARYRANLLGTAGDTPLNGLVRLRGGEQGVPRFRADLARVAGGANIDIVNRAEAVRHTRDVIGFESACLLAFGLAAFLAALVLVGQAIIRYGAASAAELRALTAVGLTRTQGVRLAIAGPVLAAVAGTAIAVGLAVPASAWLPFGAAAAREPDPGVDVDWLVLGGFAVLIPVLVAAGTAVAVWAGLSAPGRVPPGRRSAVVAAMAAAGLPVAVVVGARFALEPGQGARAVPVRPALLGAVTGVFGVLAAFTFSAGVADAAANPARFGQNYQLMVIFGFGGQDFLPPRPVLDTVADDADVLGVIDMRVAGGRSGELPVVTYTYEPVGAPVPLVLTEGRAPAADDEVVLAPVSARQLGAGIGATIPLAGDKGSRALRVTGIGFGVESSTRGYDSGAWVTGPGYDQLFTGFKEHGGLLVLRQGSSPDAVAARLTRAATGPDGIGPLLTEPFAPRQFGEIRNVRVLPLVLGGFLALLAVGAVGHALIVAVRRRGHDLAVLRALGMTRGQCRLAVVTQAGAITTLGLLAGIPLGMALGRILWRAAAGIMPLQYQPPTSPWTLILIVPLALLVAALLAAGPGRHAGHRNLGQALRAE
ncbi:hypothetical protein GCM10010160_72330 [Acrocarpospora corrugata]